jgi:hypothetical protein
VPAGEGVPDYVQAAGSLPTLATMRALVYAPLRDTERSFVEPWFVDTMLNEGYLDLNARLRLNKKQATGTASSTGTIDIPTDLVELENLYVATLPVSWADDDTFLSFKNAGVSPYGLSDEISILARVNIAAGKIETYPAATLFAYALEYVARPTEMVADTDTPSILTKELAPRIVAYARAHAKWQEGQEQEGAKYMAMYEQGLPGAPRDAFRRKPFPLAMIPEAGPFG